MASWKIAILPAEIIHRISDYMIPKKFDGQALRELSQVNRHWRWAYQTTEASAMYSHRIVSWEFEDQKCTRDMWDTINEAVLVWMVNKIRSRKKYVSLSLRFNRICDYDRFIDSYAHLLSKFKFNNFQIFYDSNEFKIYDGPCGPVPEQIPFLRLPEKLNSRAVFLFARYLRIDASEFNKKLARDMRTLVLDGTLWSSHHWREHNLPRFRLKGLRSLTINPRCLFPEEHDDDDADWDVESLASTTAPGSILSQRSDDDDVDTRPTDLRGSRGSIDSVKSRDSMNSLKSMDSSNSMGSDPISFSRSMWSPEYGQYECENGCDDPSQCQGCGGCWNCLYCEDHDDCTECIECGCDPAMYRDDPPYEGNIDYVQDMVNLIRNAPELESLKIGPDVPTLMQRSFRLPKDVVTNLKTLHLDNFFPREFPCELPNLRRLIIKNDSWNTNSSLGSGGRPFESCDLGNLTELVLTDSNLAHSFLREFTANRLNYSFSKLAKLFVHTKESLGINTVALRRFKRQHTRLRHFRIEVPSYRAPSANLILYTHYD